MGAPFDLMVNALGFIANSASAARRDFINLSAGVNWRPAETKVISLLKRELDLSLSTRNYGNAGGAPVVTRTLESLENHIHGCQGLAVALCHGTTEGANLALDSWRSEGSVQAGDHALAVGHSFGLYHRLATERALLFHDCLGDESNVDTFMPSEQMVAEALEIVSPRVIFLLLPNNPLGEIVDRPTLVRIVDYVRKHGARLLVDRVCLMPWDAPTHVRELIGPLARDGLAMMSDSFSKAESLAGLRMGYIVTDARSKARIVEMIKSRYLNPQVFGSATLALTRAVSYGQRRARQYVRACLSAHDRLFGEYPPSESFRDFLIESTEALPTLALEMAARRQHIQDNFHRLRATFSGRATRALRLDGGFNVALALDAMAAHRETADHLELANIHGVGVLTSRCFCQDPVGLKYFVRIGLTLPGEVFEQGLERLDKFYHH
jgi:aspartate/methionine/tyrosine aminotransferase